MRNQGILFIMGLVRPGQWPHTVGYGPQPTPLGTNSIKNSRISSGCHYTPLELLWPQVAPNSVATSSHYENVLVEVHQFFPTQCKLYLYQRCAGLFPVEFTILIYGKIGIQYQEYSNHEPWDFRGGPWGFKRWPPSQWHVMWHLVPRGT